MEFDSYSAITLIKDENVADSSESHEKHEKAKSLDIYYSLHDKSTILQVYT
jgi:hypothetical protein